MYPPPARGARNAQYRAFVQAVLDVNVQAEGAEYCDIADVSPSPGDHRLAAYAADMTGYEVGMWCGVAWCGVSYSSVVCHIPGWCVLLQCCLLYSTVVCHSPVWCVIYTGI